MNTRFKGLVVYNTQEHHLTPAHFNYVQGYLTRHVSAHPDHRNHIAICTPVDMNTIEVEIYDPKDAVSSHLETNITQFEMVVGGSDEPPSKPKKEVFKPPVGEA